MNGLIAFPSKGSGGLDASVSAHFGSCASFTLVDIGDGGATAAIVLSAPAHDDGGCAERVRRLAERGVRGVVISSIGGHALFELQQAGITVWRDQSQRPVAALVEAMRRGQIPQLAAGPAHDSDRPAREGRCVCH
jgi:predicted Fe-Mo cluster-binding NifX family protein